MVGIDLSDPNGEPLPAQTGHRVAMAARPLGAILRPLGNTIVLNPPLSITKSELEELVTITSTAIQRTVGES